MQLLMKEQAQQPHEANPVHDAVIVIGLGVTGLSVARHLCARGDNVTVMDSRDDPPGLAALLGEFPQIRVVLGALDKKLLCNASRVILSPGVALSEPAVRAALDAGVEVIGDIELFVREAAAPIAAITGSNGKSTVTAMLGDMARVDGCAVRVGGNLGEPALALLEGETAQLYVLELSSFQLETTWSLAADVAAVLNVTADHLDRYTDFAHYSATKARILNGARVAVINLDDPQLALMPFDGARRLGFSIHSDPQAAAYINLIDDEDWLCVHGENIMRAADVALVGRHNLANALAAMLMASELGISNDAMRRALEEFKGLAHRCALVASIEDVRWVDDSKGTNVGSTVAAIEGLEAGRSLVLIAGGLAKGQDFAPLRAPIDRHVHTIVLIGKDCSEIDRIAPLSVNRVFVQSMQEAVDAAAAAAQRGDTVLLSPACASMDMFLNYAARGDAFSNAVHELISA
jgi:UDP-N-acetylmuramoylalanine--D-glutamate ligase